MSRKNGNKIEIKHITLLIRIMIIGIIALSLLCIGSKSYASLTGESITTAESWTKTLLKQDFSRTISYYLEDNIEMDFFRLKDRRETICTGKGDPVISVKSETNPGKDATVEVGGKSYVKRQVEDGDKIGQYTANGKDAVSRYGEPGKVVDTSRTIGIYNKVSEGDLSPSRAYIYSFKEDTSSYPGVVQQAAWINQANTSSSLPNLTGDLQSAGYAREIAKEGLMVEESIKANEEFRTKNNGNPISNVTDYANLKTIYNKENDTIISGKYKFDFVSSANKRVYGVNDGQNSKLVDENGVVLVSGIQKMEIYADDNMNKKLDYELVFPNRNYNDKTQAYTEYPQANEEFYIVIKNASKLNTSSLSKIKFDMMYLTAEGYSYQLEGSFKTVDWVSEDEPIKCSCTIGRCSHGYTRPHKIAEGVECTSQTQCYRHPDAQVGDGHPQSHKFYVAAKVITHNEWGQPAEIVKYGEVKEQVQPAVAEMGLPIFGGLPIFFPYDRDYRDPEYVYVPVVPEDPDPNIPPDEPDPEIPDDPEPEIKLTFDLSGNVWVDNPSGKESLANGEKDAGEASVQNVEVYLYRKGEKTPIDKTLTNSDGYYIFKYIPVAHEYYVEFVYDGMTYKTTKYLGSDITEYSGQSTIALNEAYKLAPELFANKSMAVEVASQRDEFNSKFTQISFNQAVGTQGVIPLSYKSYMSEQGAVSALITTDTNYLTYEPFRMTVSTATTGLYYPLDDKYVVDDEDLVLVDNGEETFYAKTYGTLKHVNLGLIKREKGDFAVKNDVYQTIVTMKENVQTYKYNDKTTSVLSYDTITRVPNYFNNNNYTLELDKSDYNWRYDSTYGSQSNIVKDVISQSDEMNVYVEYKFLIRNQSSLQFGNVIELYDYFDSSLEYSEEYDFTDMTSWIEVNMIDEDGEVQREEIKWEEHEDVNGYKKISTKDLADKTLLSGQTIELHLILKVKKDANRNILMDLEEEDNGKQNILEIGTFSFNEGLVDRDSNPGSSVLITPTTYEDDTDFSRIKLIFKTYEENGGLGKVISGYAWEDYADKILSNNLYTGNGAKDDKEKEIANVKVELIEVLMDKSTGKSIEIIRQNHGKDYIRTGKDGSYKFTNLDTGTYKVKFTYGDSEQLEKDITYNGQDYKTVSTDTLTQQYERPGLEVMILADTSEGMQNNSVGDVVRTSVKDLVNSLYNKVQTIKVGGILFSEPKTSDAAVCTLKIKPASEDLLKFFEDKTKNKGTSLEDAVNNAITQFSAGAKSKVIVICTDGYISSDARGALEKASEAGIKVISVVSSTDEWTINTFGTEGSPTAGKLYYIRDVHIREYMSEVALEDILQIVRTSLTNITNAKDIQKEYVAGVNSSVGTIYTRQNNMDYSKVLTYKNASIIDGKDTTNRTEFAKNTQMTAITPITNVLIEHNNTRTSGANLGLIERPKVELQITERISGISVKLSTGETIIDTDQDLTKNVQIIPNSKYAIYMDEEIMQGATINVRYELCVTNNSQVDILGEYFDYDMYKPLEEAQYTATVPTKAGTIYSYYSNLTFRAEDNNNWIVMKNDTSNATNARFNGTSLTNWNSFIKSGKSSSPKLDTNKITLAIGADGQIQFLNDKVKWENKASVQTGVEDDPRFDNNSVQVVQTTSLRNIPLYPIISKEAISGAGVSSISTYIQFSKVMSPNDENDTLEYKQSVEIVERNNDLGRRDYVGVPGNYSPHAEITEYDSAKVEDIAVLTPLGDTQKYYALTAICIVIIIIGVVIIKKRMI